MIGHTASGAEVIANLLDESYIVKACNAVFAEVYAGQDPRIDEQVISIFFAGDDPDAKTKVGELLSRLDFDPVDAEPLQNARYLERFRCSIFISATSWDSARRSPSPSSAKAGAKRIRKARTN